MLGYVLGFGGRQGNGWLPLGKPAYRAAVEHEDESGCRLPALQVLGPVRVRLSLNEQFFLAAVGDPLLS